MAAYTTKAENCAYTYCLYNFSCVPLDTTIATQIGKELFTENCIASNTAIAVNCASTYCLSSSKCVPLDSSIST